MSAELVLDVDVDVDVPDDDAVDDDDVDDDTDDGVDDVHDIVADVKDVDDELELVNKLDVLHVVPWKYTKHSHN